MPEAPKLPDLRRELRLRDLVLFQIIYVLGPVGIGPAALLGRSHTWFWLAAVGCFFVPQAALVIALSRQWPLEGGLYQWVKFGFSERLGFLTAWNLWLCNITLAAYAGVTIINHLVYALGPGAQWMSDSKALNVGFSALVLGSISLLSVRGLGVGKWVHNTGAACIVLCYAALLLLPLAGVAEHRLPAYAPLPLAFPAFTLVSVNVFSKLMLQALIGLEEAAVLAGECHDPARHLTRATWIAGPVIALLFILGTSSLLAFVPADKIDLAAPFPQAVQAATHLLGIRWPLLPLVCAGLIVYWFAGASCAFAAVTRLPLVAGWDYLLPGWFTKLHPVWRTPVNSILFTALLSLAIVSYSLLGAGHEETFQLLLNQVSVFNALAYLPMFALPLLGRVVAGPGLKTLAALGFASTLFYIVQAVFPLVDVQSRGWFAFKVLSLIGAANLSGVALYRAGERRQRQATTAAA